METESQTIEKKHVGRIKGITNDMYTKMKAERALNQPVKVKGKAGRPAGSKNKLKGIIDDTIKSISNEIPRVKRKYTRKSDSNAVISNVTPITAELATKEKKTPGRKQGQKSKPKEIIVNVQNEESTVKENISKNEFRTALKDLSHVSKIFSGLENKANQRGLPLSKYIMNLAKEHNKVEKV